MESDLVNFPQQQKNQNGLMPKMKKKSFIVIKHFNIDGPNNNCVDTFLNK